MAHSIASVATSSAAPVHDYLAPVFAQYPLHVERAEGVWLITPEVAECALAASGVAADFNFVPHSGPFARGIHVTVQATLSRPVATAELLAALQQFYAHAPFVAVGEQAPRIKDVVGSNYARLSVASNGRSVAVTSVLDNLNKGAAGGAVQWMNRLHGLPETAGLTAPAAGWT